MVFLSRVYKRKSSVQLSRLWLWWQGFRACGRGVPGLVEERTATGKVRGTCAVTKADVDVTRENATYSLSSAHGEAVFFLRRFVQQCCDVQLLVSVASWLFEV